MLQRVLPVITMWQSRIPELLRIFRPDGRESECRGLAVLARCRHVDVPVGR